MRKKSDCCDEKTKVLSISPIGEGYWTLRLRAPQIAGQARPGQFVHIRVPGLEASALRRPFSIYGAEGDELRILFKVVGRGSEALSRVQAGVAVPVLGPLGNGFPKPAKGTVPVCVAGGYGVAPLSFLAKRTGAGGITLIGGRTAADILAAADFEPLGWTVKVATQDGSLGTKGLVTVLLEETLGQLREEGKKAEIFACGPTGMLRAVGAMAETEGSRAWLSLDERMVCGVGACLGCVQKIRREDGSEYLARVCKDGPVFESRTIVW
ncbi:MAG: dihydroorotate dehydrogenase electron transfer subunit [Kiritimatiellae bacterium]|nr:dihydroorotate dehydrogenase electron transfer subunit [Kiritimatiellia bacterium]